MEIEKIDLKNQYRGILVDIDDPPTTSETDNNLTPPPSLVNGIAFILQEIFKSIMSSLSLVLGFGTEIANNVIIGKSFKNIKHSELAPDSRNHQTFKVPF